MSKRQQAAATATFGYGGVAGGALLRNEALADAYGERPNSTRAHLRRPVIGAERRLLKHPTGRRRFIAGTALAAISTPAAIKGTHDVLSKRRTFVEEGVSGVAESLRERNANATRAPARLVAGNYAAGTGVAAAGAGAAHLLMRSRKIGSGGKSVIASGAGILAGTASLPLQRKVIEHRTRGAFTVTPTGLKRAPKPVNHGARHGTRVAKKNDRTTGMSRAEELRNLKRKQRSAAVNAVTSAGGIGSLGLLGAAALPHVRNRGGLVRTATTLGTASAGVSALNSLESSRLNRRDLRAREKVLLAKGVSPRKPALIFWSGDGFVRMNDAARAHPRRRAHWASALAGKHGHKASGGTIGQFEALPNEAVYERQHGRVIKAFGIPRAPRIRTGFLRQTRTATGVRTSTVRGGLVR